MQATFLTTGYFQFSTLCFAICVEKISFQMKYSTNVPISKASTNLFAAHDYTPIYPCFSPTNITNPSPLKISYTLMLISAYSIIFLVFYFLKLHLITYSGSSVCPYPRSLSFLLLTFSYACCTFNPIFLPYVSTLNRNRKKHFYEGERPTSC